MFSSAGLSLAAEKMRKNLLITGGFLIDFTESLRLSVSSVKTAALGSVKWVTRRMFKICKYFQRSKLKL